jgi:hypothetical protein
MNPVFKSDRGLCSHARRDLLVSGAALGAAMLLPVPVRAAQIYSMSGKVRVNGRPARTTTPIKPGDHLTTGPGAKVVFIVGTDAFLLHADSDVKLEAPKDAASKLIGGFRMLTGALLAVFDHGPRRLQTPMMTIGIRGTGVYLEASAQMTTLCTCYGDVEVWNNKSGERRRIISGYHTPIVAHERELASDMMPMEPMEPMAAGHDMEAAHGMKEDMGMGHSDGELIMLEKLVGRVSPITLLQQKLQGAKEQALRDAASANPQPQ